MMTSAYFTLDPRIKLMDLKNHTNIIFEISDLKREFRRAELFRINDSFYSLGCIVKQAKGSISLRKFTIK